MIGTQFWLEKPWGMSEIRIGSDGKGRQQPAQSHRGQNLCSCEGQRSSWNAQIEPEGLVEGGAHECGHSSLGSGPTLHFSPGSGRKVR